MGNKVSRPKKNKLGHKGHGSGKIADKKQGTKPIGNKKKPEEVRSQAVPLKQLVKQGATGNVLGGESTNSKPDGNGRSAAARAAEARLQKKKDEEKISKERLDLNKTKSKAEKGL